MKETRDFLKENLDFQVVMHTICQHHQRDLLMVLSIDLKVPGIQGPKVKKALLETLDDYSIWIHRVTQTRGIMMLTDEEISSMVSLAEKWQVELNSAIGPRAT